VSLVTILGRHKRPVSETKAYHNTQLQSYRVLFLHLLPCKPWASSKRYDDTAVCLPVRYSPGDYILSLEIVRGKATGRHLLDMKFRDDARYRR
jgi:hypothetical protein